MRINRFWLRWQADMWAMRICHVFGHAWEPYEVHKYSWRCGRMHTYTNYRCKRCKASVWYTYIADSETIAGRLHDTWLRIYYRLHFKLSKYHNPPTDNDLPF